MASKKELRNEYRLKRNALSYNFRKDASKIICENILSLDAYKNAKTIMGYLAINSETALDNLICDALKNTKTVLLPVTDVATQTMHASVLSDISKMSDGNYGILEPENKAVFDASKIDVIILPALVYNYDGFRIGYGKGYYDKFLASNKNAIKIGAAFSCQLCKEQFGDEFDVCVDMIVTEKGVIHCGELTL